MSAPREPRNPAPADEADQETGDPRQRPSDDSVAPDRQEGVHIENGKPVRRWGDALGIERDTAPLNE